MNRRTNRAILLIILGGAAVLRFWALDQGLPHPSTRPDEREVLQYTLGFANGDWNPRWFINPNLYLYLVWAWCQLALAARRLFVPTPDYAEVFATNLPLLLLAGRAFSAVAGTATVGFVYGIGRRLGGERVGLIAAAVLATNLIHVRDSHALKPDALVTLGALLSLWLLARQQEHPTFRRATLAGLAIGITTGIKYNGVLLLAPAWLADALGSSGRGWRRVVPSRHILVLGTVAVLSYLASGPYFVLDFARTWDTFLFSMWTEYSTRPAARPAAAAGWLTIALTWVRTRAFGYHLLVSLRRGCGLVMALVAPVALAAGLRPPRRPMLTLSLAFVLVHYLVVGASPVHLTRYFTPVVPLLALAAAVLCDGIVARATSPGARGALALVLTLALVTEPLATSIRHDHIAAQTDTRVLALDWMATNVPPGAVVAILGSPLVSYSDPVLPPGRTRLPNNVPVSAYPDEHVGYVVTHEHLLPFSRPDAGQMAHLAPHLRLLAEFRPYPGAPAGVYEDEDAYYVPLWHFDGVERAGPVVRIYAYTP